MESPPEQEVAAEPQEAAAPPPRKFIFSPRVPPTMPSSKTAVLTPPAPAKKEKKRETAPLKPPKTTALPPVVRYERPAPKTVEPLPAPIAQEETPTPPRVEQVPRRRVEPPVMAVPKKPVAKEPAEPQESDSSPSKSEKSSTPEPQVKKEPVKVVAKRAVDKKKPPKEKKREKIERPGFFRRLADRFTSEEAETPPDVTKKELPEKTSAEPIVVEVRPAKAPTTTQPTRPHAPTTPQPQPAKVIAHVVQPPKPAPSKEPLNLKDDLLSAPGETMGAWKILVTGGGGFLGRAILEKLHVRGLKARSYSRSDYIDLRRFGTEHFRGDLANADALKRAVDGCDIVFHTAALAGVWGPYGEYHKVNVVGTQNVIDACRAAGVKRLVYTSSPSVIFDGSDMQGVNESAPYPKHYHTAYPKTKALAEQMVLAANSVTLPTVSLRPHLIWGPGDHQLVPRILARAASLRIIGGANKKVDSVYIDNAADAHLLAAGRLRPDSPVSGKAYFITNGEPRPLWELVNGILAAGKLPPVTRGVSRGMAFGAAMCLEMLYSLFGIEGEPRLTRFVARELTTAHWFDISAARRDLNYKPVVSIDDGLIRLRAWLQGGGARLLRQGR